MGRVIILGIDGLEYDLVQEWGLKNLKQEAQSRLDLSDFGVIITPLIWAAMITGKKDEEIEKIFLDRARYFSKQGDTVKNKQKQYWHARIAAKILPTRIKKMINRKVLSDPFKETADIIKRRKKTTLFDFYKRPWDNGVPSYGLCVTSKRSKELSEIALTGNLKPLYEDCMLHYGIDRAKLMKALKEDHDLIFWYTSFLDKLSHFYIVKKKRLLNVYMDLNMMVKEVKAQMGPDDVLYIISDHGMEPMEGGIKSGDHSDHGFFSSSTGETIKDPQGLFDIVKARGAR